MAYEHLKKALDEEGKTQTELADLLGRTPPVITNLFQGVRKLQLEEAQKISAWLRRPLDFILTGTPPPPPRDSAPASDDYINIPVYNVTASAGHGAWLQDDACIIDRLAFRREWLRKHTSATPEQLAVVKVSGDSMEPAINEGDSVLIDRTQTHIAGGGVFVIEQDGALLVKRLTPLPGGRVLVISDNDRYPPYEIAEGGAIVGRAIHKMGDV